MRTSLAVRVGLTVIVAFLAVSVLAFAFMFRRSDLNAEAAVPAPEKVAIIAALIEVLPPDAKEMAILSPLLEISIVQGASPMDVEPKTGVTQKLDEIRDRYRAAMPGRDLFLGTWGEPL